MEQKNLKVVSLKEEALQKCRLDSHEHFPPYCEVIYIVICTWQEIHIISALLNDSKHALFAASNLLGLNSELIHRYVAVYNDGT